MAKTKRYLTTAEKNQLKVARKTLSYSDTGALIMGPPTKDDARKTIFLLTGRHPTN